MRRILLFVLAMCVAASTVFAAGGKFAFVDTQTVFDKTKLGKKFQVTLKEYFDSRKKILDLDADDIQKLREDYAKQASVLKPEARKEKEETIARKFNDFEKKRNDFNNELAKKQEELFGEFNVQMGAVLKELAKREKLSIIFSRSIPLMNKGDAQSILYGDEDLDLTEKVIADMDKRFESGK